MLELTELQKLKLENFSLKHNALQQQLQVNLSMRAAFIKEIETENPDYRWDEQKGFVSNVVGAALKSVPIK